jgi:Domain of unknown function (DUF397)
MTPRGIDVSRAVWRKSSRSGGNGGQCVEVALFRTGGPGTCLVRDSKDPEGPALAFTTDEWRSFAAAVKAGQFDLG